MRRLDKDIYHVRYFSPVKEVSLSGHAALAAFWTLAERGYIDGREEIRRVRQYTKAGALYVDFNFANEEIRFVDVQLPKMEIALEAEAVASVAAAFKLKEKDIGGEKGLKPAVIDAGIKTMVIPLTSPDALRDMEPKRRRMGELTEKYGVQCFHLFYYDGANRVVQRNFSPAVGIWEESGTGTGSGAMYFYLKEKGLLREEKIICCQGEEMGRPSEIVLREKDGSIYAGGKACVVMEGIMRL